MNTKNQNLTKLYYSIGEVAEMFDVNTSLIRFWEKEFEIIKPQKNARGNRVFTKDDVSNFQLIYVLVKERGYTLKGAKDKMKIEKKRGDINKENELISSLKMVKDFLLDIKKEL